eukprot:9356993-Alexandrium_andersonii.AAC.1
MSEATCSQGLRRRGGGPARRADGRFPFVTLREMIVAASTARIRTVTPRFLTEQSFEQLSSSSHSALGSVRPP